MAILLDSPFGQISGKLSGSIFMPGKGLNLIKSVNGPKSNNSQSQIAHKNLFSTIVTSWKSLTSETQKTFVPDKSNSKLSAFNLYFQYQFMKIKLIQKTTSVLTLILPTAPTFNLRFEEINMNPDPPDNSFIVNFKNGLYEFAYIDFQYIHSSDDFKMRFKVNFSSPNFQSSSNSVFTNSSGQNLGICVYHSETHSVPGLKYRYPDKNILVSSGLILSYSSFGSVQRYVDFIITIPQISFENKYNISTGKYALFKFYAYNKFGQKSLLHSEEYLIT